MTTKNSNRALLTSVVALILCCSMLIGSTFAWFTDSAASGSNVITSGNLDIFVEYSLDGKNWADLDGAKDLFHKGLWEPGHTEVVALRITNKGSLALKYSAHMNIFSETIGKTKDGEEIKLSDILTVSALTFADAGVDTVFGINIAEKSLEEAFKSENGIAYDAAKAFKAANVIEDAEKLMPNATQYVVIKVDMPESVGNEANHDGIYAPAINFGLTVMATQVPSESDSFNDQYDALAGEAGYGGAIWDDTVTPPLAGMDIPVYEFGHDGELAYKMGSVVVTKASIETIGEEVKASFLPSTYEGNITIANGMENLVYDISVTNLKAANTAPVKVEIYLGENMDPDTVSVYHYDTEIHATYEPTSGYVRFETLEFSPFTMVFDVDSVYVPEESGPEGLPVAVVTNSQEYENVDLPWGNFGGFCPTEGLDSHLEAAYTFTCKDTPEEAEANKYAEWYCDFVVKLDKDLGANQIFLGGNYGSFGWVGFHNGDMTLEANTEIPLLGSVTENPWTYADVASFVGTFICGVGDVDDALKGATFTVMLRLTNPADETEFYNVATINYTFE